MYKDMMDTIGFVSGYDPELGAAMQRELGRQQANIELIASENIVSPCRYGCHGQRADQQICRGATPATAITAAASLWIRLSRLRLTVPASCLVPNMPTCSPIPAHRPTWPFTLPCSTWAIPSWAWIFPRAAI